MTQRTLFDSGSFFAPLASRVRPRDLDEFVGQRHLLAPGKVLRAIIENDAIASMIFWGPPGVGKTTLAKMIADRTKSAFVDFSAVTSGIKEIKDVMKRADESLVMGERTVLFVDEIHRFNRAQQDAFLPYVERGSITLIGATTENPSFEVNSALLSRCKVFVLQALSVDDVVLLLSRAAADDRAFGHKRVLISPEALRAIAVFSNGDARTALNALEMAALNSPADDASITIADDTVQQITGRRSLLYDKQGEEHYNLISALHKSMRNSDVQASIYWLARMLEAGEEPLYIARRIVRFASEDVGLADSRALEVAVAAYQACHFLGMPECGVHLTHAAAYMSLAPKSNAVDVAYIEAAADASKTLAEPVPLHIRNAPTRLMKELGYGEGYQYAHDTEERITAMHCLPPSLEGREYYRPTAHGAEERIGRLMERIEEWKRRRRAEEES